MFCTPSATTATVPESDLLEAMSRNVGVQLPIRARFILLLLARNSALGADKLSHALTILTS